MSIVDKLTPHPPQVEGAEVEQKLKPELTADETTLLHRCASWALVTLKKHGVTLTGDEARRFGAEVADFVTTISGEAAEAVDAAYTEAAAADTATTANTDAAYTEAQEAK